jgi:hypothetical protein
LFFGEVSGSEDIAGLGVLDRLFDLFGVGFDFHLLRLFRFALGTPAFLRAMAKLWALL